MALDDVDSECLKPQATLNPEPESPNSTNFDSNSLLLLTPRLEILARIGHSSKSLSQYC